MVEKTLEKEVTSKHRIIYMDLNVYVTPLHIAVDLTDEDDIDEKEGDT